MKTLFTEEVNSKSLSNSCQKPKNLYHMHSLLFCKHFNTTVVPESSIFNERVTKYYTNYLEILVMGNNWKTEPKTQKPKSTIALYTVCVCINFPRNLPWKVEFKKVLTWAPLKSSELDQCHFVEHLFSLDELEGLPICLYRWRTGLRCQQY